ncbi:Galactonate dehydratase [Halococcus salifodinae DSM 8989]|uniref:Galactonate dehydratase n=1 Tax=Halococcus salifodinae DSM 8989 TaxID=1227456 RepID=M0N8S9_9EURY|nr:Galactonate dehydratase [Halococcus salifodinae DSM 8989]
MAYQPSHCMPNYRTLRDSNAEYTIRDLFSETMGLSTERPGPRNVEITDV